MADVCYSDLYREARLRLSVELGQPVLRRPEDPGYYVKRMMIARTVAESVERVAELEARGPSAGVVGRLAQAVGPRLAQAVRHWDRVPSDLGTVDGMVTVLLSQRALVEAIDADDAEAEAQKAASGRRCRTGRPEATPAMLTTHDVAERLNCSYGHARSLILSGRLKHTRDGRMLRTTQEWLDEYVATQTRGEPPSQEPLAAEEERRPKSRPAKVSVPQGGFAAEFLKKRKG